MDSEGYRASSGHGFWVQLGARPPGSRQVLENGRCQQLGVKPRLTARLGPRRVGHGTRGRCRNGPAPRHAASPPPHPVIVLCRVPASLAVLIGAREKDPQKTEVRKRGGCKWRSPKGWVRYSCSRPDTRAETYWSDLANLHEMRAITIDELSLGASISLLSGLENRFIWVTRWHRCTQATGDEAKALARRVRTRIAQKRSGQRDTGGYFAKMSGLVRYITHLHDPLD